MVRYRPLLDRRRGREAVRVVDLCLLGCGGMMPLPHRRLTALLYRFGGKMILIDCGEGTQVSIGQAGWGFKPLEAIFFTHYHADHIAGLPGLLLTLGNYERKEPLTLFGPPGLFEVVSGLMVIAPAPPFDMTLVELPAGGPSQHRVGDIWVTSAPAEHRMPCLAYSLEIRRPGRFDPQKAESLGIPRGFWKSLQKGEDAVAGERRFTPDMVLGGERKGIKITYCTDTRPSEGLIRLAEGSDLLICEGLYGEEEKAAAARERQHMIFSEAAAMARAGKVRELWLTHYSPALKEPEAFLDNARRVFSNCEAGYDLMTKTFTYGKE